MPDREYTHKLNKLKSKTKRSSVDKAKYVKYIFVTIVAIGIISIGYMAYNTITSKNIEDVKKFTDSKENGINGINQMFSAYPNDPDKALYITQIKNAKSSDEINNILNNAKNYIAFKNYKVNSVNLIKNTYGKYYTKSIYAQSLTNEIENANSKEEINKIISSANIEEDAKKYYLEAVLSKIGQGENFEVDIGGAPKIMSKEELSEYVSKMSLSQLKTFELTTPVSFNKITMIVGATQCGKMPLKGDQIYIYDKSNPNNTPIEGIVNSSYIIASEISYTESKSTSSSISDGSGDSTSASSSSSISYNLGNINGILHATAIDKLDPNKIKDKFGNYGIKLNEISEDTQIFDESVQYVLILSVPSNSVSTLISLDASNIYIVKAG